MIPGDTFKLIIMMKINYKAQFYILQLKERIKGGLLRFGCHFFSSWYFIDNDCICTTGNVLKINRIYTYKEGDNVEIVRLTKVHTERKYLYCSLFFISRNKIITVRQTMLKDAPILWSLSDNKEFDELMSIKLWNEVSRAENLLEFDF
jgi:hypothetical protein